MFLRKFKISSKVKVLVWFVSNCNRTSGARMRWEYGQRLIHAGLKIKGYGQGSLVNKIF